MKNTSRYKKVLATALVLATAVLLLFSVPVSSLDITLPTSGIFITMPTAYGSVPGTTGGAASFTSEDNEVTFNFEAGTTGTVDGQPVTEVSVQKIPDEVLLERPIPEDKTRVALVYEFGPKGAHFSKPVNVCMEFDPLSVPEGQTPVIVRWNETISDWEEIPGSTPNFATGVICAPVSDFSVFTVVATPKAVIDWWLIGGITGGVLVLTALITWLILRRRGAD